MDELLHPFIRAAVEEDASHELERLFTTFIQPLCGEVTRRYLRTYGNGDRADQEAEVQSDAMLQLAGRLKALRKDFHDAQSAPDSEIGNLRSYVVSTVFNAAYARIRSNSPKRAQLQNRVRYLLRNDGRFALWKTESGEYLAGIVQWKGRPLGVPAPAPAAQTSAGKLDGVMLAAFERAGGPLGLGELVSLSAAVLGVTDPDPVSIDKAEPTARGPSADQQLIERQSLRQLWEEVLELPEKQRTALLLNLRGADGHGVIELLPATGVATLRELAAATGLTAEALAQLWNDLPLDDAAISKLLGISRQQVINLRKSARERLNRRLQRVAGNPEGNSPSVKGAGEQGDRSSAESDGRGGALRRNVQSARLARGDEREVER